MLGGIYEGEMTMDDELLEKINLQVKSRQFELASTAPFVWKAKSQYLKHAADRLFDLYYYASLRLLERLKSDKSTDQADRCCDGQTSIG